MNPKERILSAINKQGLGKIPCDYWGTQEVTDMLKNHLGVETELDLWKRLGIDKIINLTPTPLGVPVSPHYVGPLLSANEDIWRVKYASKVYADGKGVYWEICFNPLAGLDTIEEVEANFVFPKADWFDFSTIEEECNRYPNYAIECGYSSPLFVYCNLRGMERALMDLVVNKEYAHFVINKICDFFYSFHEKLFESAKGLIDIAEVTDDFGTQTGLLISPENFDQFFKPHHERLIKLVKDFGIKVFHHDDGAIRLLIPKLIELGIDVLNPIQWKLPGMDPSELKENFGKAVCFHGGVDNQETLPFGKPEDVEREVLYLLETLGSDGTGYILAPCHNIQPITPVENIIALYETVNHYGIL